MKIEAPGLPEAKSGFDIIPANTRLNVRVVGCEVETKQSMDKVKKELTRTMLAWEFDVFAPAEYVGRKLWTRTVTTLASVAELNSLSATERTDVLNRQTQAHGFLKGLCDAAHIPYDATGLETTDALGAELTVKVGVREYDGKDSNEIKGYYELSD